MVYEGFNIAKGYSKAIPSQYLLNSFSEQEYYFYRQQNQHGT